MLLPLEKYRMMKNTYALIVCSTTSVLTESRVLLMSRKISMKWQESSKNNVSDTKGDGVAVWSVAIVAAARFSPSTSIKRQQIFIDKVVNLVSAHSSGSQVVYESRNLSSWQGIQVQTYRKLSSWWLSVTQLQWERVQIFPLGHHETVFWWFIYASM